MGALAARRRMPAGPPKSVRELATMMLRQCEEEEQQSSYRRLQGNLRSLQSRWYTFLTLYEQLGEAMCALSAAANKWIVADIAMRADGQGADDMTMEPNG